MTAPTKTKTDDKTTTPTATTKEASLNDSVPTGGRAAESGDPVVQRLLAMRDGHLMNRDTVDPPVVDENILEDIDEAIANIDDQLAELGFPQESPTDRKTRLQKAAEAAAKVDKAAADRRADRAKARADRAEAASR